MSVTNNFEKEFFCVPNGKVQHLILYMFFFLLGFERGGGERIFLVFNVFPSKFLVGSHRVPTII